jgi:quercetin dioxygenase-like cupin family protein
MEERKQDDTINRPEGERTIDAPFVSIDLPHFIEMIKNEKVWQDSDHNAITVFKDDQLTVTLVAMHPGAEIHTLLPKHLWTAQVLSGQLHLTTEDNVQTLTKNQMIVLHAGVSYSLQAEEESMILLHVAGEENGGEDVF